MRLRTDPDAAHSAGRHAPADIGRVVEHFFRHEAGKIVSTLTRIFGIEHLSRAEDVVQETLVRALQTWPYYGVPKNPSAWITQVAKNLAFDLIRRDRTFRHKEAEIARMMEAELAETSASDGARREIADDRLHMIFVCCHPAIPQDAQVALALRTLCGFSAEEIARAFLSSEAAIAKRLTRAKQKIRAAGIPFEVPSGDELAARLGGVLQTLYLLFNEGYKASEGERLIKADLCHEAIRLATLLSEHPAANVPAVHALLALMLMNGARLPARMDGAGAILRLEEQDRSRWDRAMIARGLYHLAQAMEGHEASSYHLQAAIAACHCAAADYSSTNWRQILSLYDRLVEIDSSPVVALNRAVALARVHGAQAGIKALRTLADCPQMQSYHLFYASLGELEGRLGDARAAVGYYRKALALATIKSEQMFLLKKIEELLDADAAGIES